MKHQTWYIDENQTQHHKQNVRRHVGLTRLQLRTLRSERVVQSAIATASAVSAVGIVAAHAAE